MSPAALLEALRARGVDVGVDDRGLHCRASRGTLTADLRAAIAAHKGELVLELEVEAATSEPDAVKARLAPMNGRLLDLYDAGDQVAARPLHAEVRDLVDSAWLPAVKRLGLALHRVGRLPAEDLPLIADELAAERGWKRGPGGWTETDQRAQRCVLHAERPLVPGDLLFCTECKVRITDQDGGPA